MDNAAACAVTEAASPMNKAMSELNSRITVQSEEVGDLIGRIRSVLTPDTPRERDAAKTLQEGPARSEVEQELVAYSERIELTIDQVRNAVSRVTL